MHLFLGAPCPDFGAFDLKLAYRGLMRLNPHCPKQALPITPEMLINFQSHLDLSDPGHATTWCAFLFGFFLMLRKSNLVPKSGNAFDSEKVLCRRDILIDDRALLVVIKWSKTNQFGQRRLKLPLLAIQGSVLCPVTAFKRMVKLNPAMPQSPAFMVRGEGKKPPRVLTYACFQSVLRQLVGLTGLNPELYSSHSFRRGGASWAFKCQVPGELIQLQGDWASDSYKRYLHVPIEVKVSVARKMRDSVGGLPRQIEI